MPEQLKPCPACGSRECASVVCTISRDEHQSLHYYVECDSCCASGPALDIEAAAIAAWNSLPRRPDYNDVDCAGCPERRRGYLTWTTEPPKVPGWYWWRASNGQNVSTLLIWSRSGVLGYYFDSEFIAELSRGEWAGPIPTPLEPEGS